MTEPNDTSVQLPPSTPQTKAERRRWRATTKFIRLLSRGLRVQKQKIDLLQNQVLSLQDAVRDLHDELATLRRRSSTETSGGGSGYYPKLRRPVATTAMVAVCGTVIERGETHDCAVCRERRQRAYDASLARHPANSTRLLTHPVTHADEVDEPYVEPPTRLDTVSGTLSEPPRGDQ